MAQNHQFLGKAYQSSGFLADLSGDSSAALQAYQQAIEQFDACIALGENTTDRVIQVEYRGSYLPGDRQADRGTHAAIEWRFVMFNFSNNHPQFSSQRRFLYMGFLILVIIACVLPGSVQPTPIVITATPPISTETPPAATETAPASASATLSITLTASNSASCTVLQDLNVRSGPGTAYNPPLAVLEEGTEFVPIGFDPQGVPGGPWVQTQVEGISQPGWVSAGSQFISCNLDFASLPSVEVPPPPKGVPPRVGTGAVDGDGIDNFRFSFDYNPDYFVRMYVFRSDDENEVFSADKDGRGIISVEFIVSSPDRQIR